MLNPNLKQISDNVVAIRDQFMAMVKASKTWIISTENTKACFGDPAYFKFIGHEKHASRCLVHLDDSGRHLGGVKIALYLPTNSSPLIGTVNIDGDILEPLKVPDTDVVLNVKKLADLLDTIETDTITNLEQGAYIDFLVKRGFTLPALMEPEQFEKLKCEVYRSIDIRNGHAVEANDAIEG